MFTAVGPFMYFEVQKVYKVHRVWKIWESGWVCCIHRDHEDLQDVSGFYMIKRNK